ncbi:unnamed protein product [Rotaria magnacalcarata]|uniref:YCII-related domain-containing protein n=1 Tax=Rotaria magnacalcarata TaxID=392030 RepID=A0A816YBU8_9BILA|nr:unnamed protein product [Rotaria magnacalcarata]CAF1615997.1 unnamed protein product [Rotaria magnacalcarata]CAF1994235.1 unnamed protein product [Rotaria magnacalcarata]CAF2000103.1 unnamed protein product [Rotaria magnacalcarata]CAF2157140.1 unnamed protein product [Rotaria magnacalcarata]
MPSNKRKVLVLHYIFNNSDFLMKRNEIRHDHLVYLRQCSKENGGKVEFKASESLSGKSFYWPLTTSDDEMIQFMQEDPYYKAGIVIEVLIYRYTVRERYRI